MQIGENTLVGGYNITCLSKGAHGVVRFTDRGELYKTNNGRRNLELAKRRTALSAAFGAYLKYKGIPVAFERMETDISVLCRKCEGNIPMEISITSEDQELLVVFDPEQNVPDAIVALASTLAKDALDCLNSLLMKHGYLVGKMDLRFGYADEIVIASMLNFDTFVLKNTDGASPRKMIDELWLVDILGKETPLSVAA